MDQGPPRSGWRSGIAHHRQGIVGNAAMEPPGRKGLAPLGFPKLPEFQWFPHAGPDGDGQGSSGIAPVEGQASPRTSLTPTHPKERLCTSQETSGAPRDTAPSPRIHFQSPGRAGMTPRHIPRLPGMGFPRRARHSSWETSVSSCWPKAGRGARRTPVLFRRIPNPQPPLGPDSTKLLSCCKVSLNWFLHPALLANFLLCHQRPDLIRQECALV